MQPMADDDWQAVGEEQDDSDQTLGHGEKPRATLRCPCRLTRPVSAINMQVRLTLVKRVSGTRQVPVVAIVFMRLGTERSAAPSQALPSLRSQAFPLILGRTSLAEVGNDEDGTPDTSLRLLLPNPPQHRHPSPVLHPDLILLDVQDSDAVGSSAEVAAAELYGHVGNVLPEARQGVFRRIVEEQPAASDVPAEGRRDRTQSA
jgi:hypothetical protein